MMTQTEDAPRLGALAEALSLPKRVSLTEMVADTIARAIALRALEPGQRITELGFANQLGTSRVPVREALKTLQTQGIVVPDDKRGFRIVAFDEGTIAQVLEARLMIETLLLRDAVRNWRETDPQATPLNMPIARMHEAAVNGDREGSLQADLDFHNAIADASDNGIVQTLWKTIARHVFIIFSASRYRADDLHAVLNHHERFRDTIRQMIREPEGESRAEQVLTDHLAEGPRHRNGG